MAWLPPNFTDLIPSPPLAPVAEDDVALPPPSALIDSDSYGLAPPPVAGSTAPAVGLPPVVYDEPGIAPPPGQAYQRAATAVDTAATEISALERQQANLLGEYQRAADPKVRQQIEKRIGAGQVAIKAAAGRQVQDRAKAQEERAVYEASINADARAAELARLEQARSEYRAAQEQATARKAQLESAAVKADEELVAAKRAYAATLRGGPKTQQSWGVMLAEMVTEGLNATMERRPLNLDKLVGRWQQQNQQAFDGVVRADQADVDFAEDALARAANERARIDQDLATQRAAIYEAAAEDIDIRVRRANSELEQAQLLSVRDAVRQGQAAAEQQARAAAAEAALRQEEQRAKIAQMRAATAKTMSEVRPRVTGTGPGDVGGEYKGIGTRRPDAVYAPGTNREIARFAGSGAEERAEKANELLLAGADTLRILNEYEAKLEDYGRRGLFEGSSFTQSEEFAELNGDRLAIVAPLSKIQAGGGAPSEGERKAAEQMIQLPSGWWQKSDTALATARSLKRNAENSLRLKASRFFAPEVVEEIVAQMRTRSVSKKDAAEEFATRAAEITADPREALETRLEGPRQVLNNARLEEERTGKPWALIAIPELAKLYDTVATQPESKERNRLKRSIAAKMAEADAALEQEQRKAVSRQRRESASTALAYSMGGATVPDDDTPSVKPYEAEREQVRLRQQKELETFVNGLVEDYGESGALVRLRKIGFRDDAIDGDEADKFDKLPQKKKRQLQRQINKTRRRPVQDE